MAGTIKDRKATLSAEFEKKVAEANKLVAKGTNAEVEAKLSDLKNIEKEFLALQEKEVFTTCADVHEALVMHHFTTLGHKVIRESGVMVGVESDDKNVVIDLKKFCEFKGFDTAWYFELQSLNKRLALRAAEELGLSVVEVKKLDDSYAMDSLAKEIDLGKTPTSDTQCVKQMQRVLDMLSEGEGKVNGHDLAYLWMCYGKRSNKNALVVMLSKHRQLMTLLTDVFHRVAIKGSYSVDYKKSEMVTEKAPKTTKSSAPKSEKKSKSKAAKPAEVPETETETVVVKKEVA